MLRSLVKVAPYFRCMAVTRCMSVTIRIANDSDNIDNMRSRLLYQSKKRGILENDIIIGDFADEKLSTIDKATLEDYDKFIMDSAGREEAKLKFIQVTQTDELLAKTLLDRAEWVLEDALQLYYGNAGSPTNSSNVSEVAEHVPLPDLSDLQISLLTWNIDGLDGNSIPTRTKTVGKIITILNPDFVFLQEVTANNKEILDNLSVNYNIHYSNTEYSYYTAILTSKMFDVLSHKVVHFENSAMGRTLQIVEGKIGDLCVFLMTTHLESMAKHSTTRKNQFSQCMQKMRDILEANPDAVILLGGDLNLRDNEVSNVPTGVADAWIASGSKQSEKFTWDTQLNNNKQAFGARCRFDRVYFYGPLCRVDFSLQGKQRIQSSLCFPSDHWAVHCVFK